MNRPHLTPIGWRALGFGAVQSGLRGISSKLRITLVVGPNTSPEASRASIA